MCAGAASDFSSEVLCDWHYLAVDAASSHGATQQEITVSRRYQSSAGLAASQTDSLDRRREFVGLPAGNGPCGDYRVRVRKLLVIRANASGQPSPRSKFAPKAWPSAVSQLALSSAMSPNVT